MKEREDRLWKFWKLAIDGQTIEDQFILKSL